MSFVFSFEILREMGVQRNIIYPLAQVRGLTAVLPLPTMYKIISQHFYESWYRIFLFVCFFKSHLV